MKCWLIKKFLTLYISEDLPFFVQDVSQHIRYCHSCYQEYLRLTNIRGMLQANKQERTLSTQLHSASSFVMTTSTSMDGLPAHIFDNYLEEIFTKIEKEKQDTLKIETKNENFDDSILSWIVGRQFFLHKILQPAMALGILFIAIVITRQMLMTDNETPITSSSTITAWHPPVSPSNAGVASVQHTTSPGAMQPGLSSHQPISVYHSPHHIPVISEAATATIYPTFSNKTSTKLSLYDKTPRTGNPSTPKSHYYTSSTSNPSLQWDEILFSQPENLRFMEYDLEQVEPLVTTDASSF